MKQDFEAVVNPAARNFMKYDGKSAAEFRMHEYVEVPIYNGCYKRCPIQTEIYGINSASSWLIGIRFCIHPPSGESAGV